MKLRGLPAWSRPGGRGGILAAIAVGCTLVLSGCATMDTRPPEEIVAERAEARWEALMAGKVSEARPYYAAGFRSGVSRDSMKARLAQSRVKWTGVDLRDISCTEDLCRPVFMVRYEFRSPLPRVGTVNSAARLEERWIRDEGEWYYVPTDVELEGLR